MPLRGGTVDRAVTVAALTPSLPYPVEFPG